MGGIQVEGGGGVFSQWGRWDETSVHTFSNLFLKILTEGAVTTEAESLFQYFTPLAEKADSHWAVVLTLAYLARVSS